MDDPLTRAFEKAKDRGVYEAAELLPIVYEELRSLASNRLAGRARGQTLQATALVHEAWLRVTDGGDPGWEGRAHFFGAAAQAMRNILVDAARRKDRPKHGGDRRRTPEERLGELSIDEPPEDLLALDELLTDLEEKDPLKARIVALRFFAGLTMAEIAEVLELTLAQVERHWRFARSWMQARWAKD